MILNWIVKSQRMKLNAIQLRTQKLITMMNSLVFFSQIFSNNKKRKMSIDDSKLWLLLDPRNGQCNKEKEYVNESFIEFSIDN